MEPLSEHEYFSLSERTVPLTVATYRAAPHECIFRAHWHRQIELLRVTEGSMRVVCADTVQTVGAGEVVFVNPYESHIGHAGESGVTYDCLIVEPILWHNTPSESAASALPRIANRLDDEEIFSHITAVVQEYHGEDSARNTMIRAHLLFVFALAQRRHSLAEGTVAESEARIGEIMRYIHRHSAERLSTAQIAREFGFSLSYFCRYFKTATGTTILEYINAVRLSHACRLLQQTDLPISTVAQEVGFTGVNYFVRQFRAGLGCAPLQFRKQNRP